MKVALINAVCGYGSTGSICVDISEKLISLGHKCYVYYGNGQSSYVHSKKITTAFGVKLHALMSRLRGLQGYNSLIATLKLIYDLEKEKYDIVHLHNLHGNFVHINLLMKYLKKSKHKTVITLHDCWFYTGKCTHYSEANCYKWMTECNNCQQLRKDIPAIFDRTKKMFNDKKNNYKDFDNLYVIGVSEWISNQAKKSMLKDNKITTIYNWVDMESFYPRKIEDKTKFIILGVSAYWDQSMPKFQDFMKLAEKLDKDILIYMVGKMNSNIMLPDNVKNICFINDKKELAYYYSLADVYVHLSREDSFGKVIIESLSCGTPAIVYNATALPEIINDSCGYIANVGDIDMVIEQINEIKIKGKKNYVQECLNRAKSFEKETILNELITFYSEMI